MKYLNRVRARLALAQLRESKAWIASKHLVLETEEGDLEVKKGAKVILGATKDGDVAIKDPTAIVVISDDDLASKVVNALTSAESLDDVKFLDKPALDAALEGATVDELVAGLVDAEDESDSIEQAIVDTAKDDSVEEKCEKIAENAIELTGNVLNCESVLIDEEDDEPINLGDVTADTCAKEDVADYEEFKARVADLGGQIQPGKKEIALTAEGKVIGYFDTDTNTGSIYLDQQFDSTEDMDNFNSEPEAVVQPAEFESALDAEKMESVEGALKAYEESAKSAKDLFAMTESLEKAGLDESAIGVVANTFVGTALKEGVNVFDTKLGKVVAAFKESIDANNYIAESGEENRFTKRYFRN